MHKTPNIPNFANTTIKNKQYSINSTSPYAYVGNAPINHTDLLGLTKHRQNPDDFNATDRRFNGRSAYSMFMSKFGSKSGHNTYNGFLLAYNLISSGGNNGNFRRYTGLHEMIRDEYLESAIAGKTYTRLLSSESFWMATTYYSWTENGKTIYYYPDGGDGDDLKAKHKKLREEGYIYAPHKEVAGLIGIQTDKSTALSVSASVISLAKFVPKLFRSPSGYFSLVLGIAAYFQDKYYSELYINYSLNGNQEGVFYKDRFVYSGDQLIFFRDIIYYNGKGHFTIQP